MEGIDNIKELIAIFKPSFLEINLKGLRTLSILNAFSRCNPLLFPESKKANKEKIITIKSKKKKMV